MHHLVFDSKSKDLTEKDIRVDIIRRSKRIVVKVGSYVLTTSTWKLDRKVFLDFSKSIAEVKRSGRDCIIVSSGAIAAGMGRLGLKERPSLIPEEQAAAAVGQIRLMGFYERLFGYQGIKVGQVLLTHSDLRDRKRFLNARHTLNSLLRYNVIPIINENDSTVVEEIKFGDNDHLSALVTNLIQADLLIIMSDIDGLFDKDPRKFEDARFISLVKSVNAGIEKLALGTTSKIGRGGMVTKIKAAKTAAHFGVPTIIANGKISGNLKKIFSAEDVGTLILPEGNKLTSRKHWIAYTLKSEGTLVVDSGAKHALLKEGKSLLPSGILDVFGEFDAGEAVRCCDKDGVEFAKGLVRYKSSDIVKIKGHKTSAITEILGCCLCHEIIHRDDLAILKEL